MSQTIISNSLYDLIFETNLVVLHAPVEKNLTQEVLSYLQQRLDGPDWLKVLVNAKTDINVSLKKEMKELISEPLKSDLVENINYLFRSYLRPPYFIFSYLEDLFKRGQPNEISQFLNSLNQIQHAATPCKIILLIDNQYLHHLHSAKKIVPNLLDFEMTF